MPVDEFWYEDIDLFFAYLKGYNKRIDTQAWLNGLYAYNAAQTAMYNIMPIAIRIGMDDKPLDPKNTMNYLSQPISSEVHLEDENNKNDDVLTEEGYKNAMINLNNM